MKGGRPKPPTLKLLAGNPGKRKVRKSLAHKRHSGRCPAELEGEERIVWERAIKPLCALGVVKLVHTPAAILACEAVAAAFNTSVEAEVIEPLTQRRREARQWLAEFGLTPASESRLIAPPTSSDDPLDRFLRETE